MKRVLLSIIAIFSIVAFATSCDNDKFGTYDFITNTVVRVTNQALASQINEAIAKDSYFSEKSSYTANFTEAVRQAADDFSTHIEKLDLDFIESQLELDDYVEISLWCMDPGNCLLYYYITPTGAVTQEE